MDSAGVGTRGWRICALVLAALVAGGCATPIEHDDATAAVGYRLDAAGRIIVDVTIDGQGPFAFAVDTGASISVMFDALQRRLQIPPEPGIVVLVHGVVSSGHFPLVKVSRVGLGRAVWLDRSLAVLPGSAQNMAGIFGIIGNDLLGEYSVGVYTSERVLRMYPPEAVSSGRYVGWAVVPLHLGPSGSPGDELYFFDVEIEGRRVRAVFDLGAGLNMVNWRAARRLGLNPRSFALRHEKKEIAGAIDETPRTPSFIATTIRTGGVVWRNEIFSIADLKIFETLSLDDRPAAILGSGLFSQRDFLIDFARPRLLVNVVGDERDRYELDYE